MTLVVGASCSWFTEADFLAWGWTNGTEVQVTGDAELGAKMWSEAAVSHRRFVRKAGPGGGAVLSPVASETQKLGTVAQLVVLSDQSDQPQGVFKHPDWPVATQTLCGRIPSLCSTVSSASVAAPWS